MVTFGSFYHMIPKLWNTTIYSLRMVYIHFFLTTIGILLYITALWVSGIGQGLMLRAFDEYGNLAYSFIETVAFMHGPLVARAIAGMFIVAGMFFMIYNIWMTIVKRDEVRVDITESMANA